MVQDTCAQVRDTAFLFLLEQVLALRDLDILYACLTLHCHAQDLTALLSSHNAFQQFIQANHLWAP